MAQRQIWKPFGNEETERWFHKASSLINKLFAKFEPEAWITPSLENGWVAYSTSYNSVGYRKDAFGLVHLRGVVKDGTGNVLFYLPVGYRPPKNLLFPMTKGDAPSAQYVDINSSTGQVYLYGYSAVWTAIDGIIFEAAP